VAADFGFDTLIETPTPLRRPKAWTPMAAGDSFKRSDFCSA
jgi:hypothetical protein